MTNSDHERTAQGVYMAHRCLDMLREHWGGVSLCCTRVDCNGADVELNLTFNEDEDDDEDNLV
jgi:hypothetical protein